MFLLLKCLCVCVCRQWVSCSFLITSPTAWSTFLTWWMIFGIMLETGPQTWVESIILDPCVLPIIPSSPLFTITHAISGLLPPRIPPTTTTTTTLPYYRAPMAFRTPSGSSHSLISKSLFCWEKKIIHVYSEHHFCPGDIVFMDVEHTLPVAVRAYKHNLPALFRNWRFFSCRWTGIPSGQHWRASITPLS